MTFPLRLFQGEKPSTQDEENGTHSHRFSSHHAHSKHKHTHRSIMKGVIEQVIAHRQRMILEIDGKLPTLWHLVTALNKCANEEDEKRLQQASTVSSAEQVPAVGRLDLNRIRHYMHLADTAYISEEKHRQHLLSLLEYRELYGRTESKRYRPAIFVAYSATRSTLVVLVRGTNQIPDLLTDIDVEANEFLSTKAHFGIARSAENLLEEVKALLLEYESKLKPDNIILTGHSLGASVSCAMKMLIRSNKEMSSLRKAFCYGFCPSGFIIDKKFAEKVENAVMIVHGIDIVPRLSTASIDRLIKRLAEIETAKPDPGAEEVLRMIHEGVENSVISLAEGALSNDDTNNGNDNGDDDDSRDVKEQKTTESMELHIPGQIFHVSRVLMKEGKGEASIRAIDNSDLVDIIPSQKFAILDHYLQGDDTNYGGLLGCLDELVEKQVGLH